MATPKKIRMKVLREFSRNLDGQIITGHPNHPEEEGRFIFVSPSAAATLEDDGDAKPFSYRDEARAEQTAEQQAARLEAVNEQREADGKEPLTELPDDDAGDNDDDEHDADDANVEGAETRDIPGKPVTAQRRREARAANRTGGSETNATTNHGKASQDGRGRTARTNRGSDGNPDDAPTE